MELIRINDKKLKIMLTSLDMKNYELDAEKLSCATEETRRAFRNILHDAGIQGGFDASADKIYVQYYPSREGGCEMFVTKLDLLGCAVAQKEALGIGESSSMSTLLMMGQEHTDTAMYVFPSLPLLLRACEMMLCRSATPVAGGEKRIRKIGRRRGEEGAVHIESSAYRCDGGTFYLLLTACNNGEKETEEYRRKCAILGEFGSACDLQKTRLYIEEHGTPLCTHHAVEILGEL